jgi:hypothetical protein
VQVIFNRTVVAQLAIPLTSAWSRDEKVMSVISRITRAKDVASASTQTSRHQGERVRGTQRKKEKTKKL